MAYAGGFATGTLVGMTVERWLAIGHRVIRVINHEPALDVAGRLREDDDQGTRVDGHDRGGPAEVVFVTVRRRDLPPLLDRIGAIAPEAFVSVERVEKVAGLVSIGSRSVRTRWWRFPQLRT